MEAKEIVFNALKNNPSPLKSGEISDKTGIDKKEVDKYIKKLVQEDRVYSPVRCFYACKK